jgi:hypothetical protein
LDNVNVSEFVGLVEKVVGLSRETEAEEEEEEEDGKWGC